MNLFLYIQITEKPEDVKFFNPIISQLKEKNIDAVFYDIDNHSESFITGYANKLLSDSDKKIILINTETESNFSKLMSLLTNILDNPEGIEIFVRGNNQKIEKMISIFTYFKASETTHESDVIERIFSKFL
jgi:calcineurin-like phosphoesterase family protein